MTGVQTCALPICGSIESPAHAKIVSAGTLENENKWSRFPVSNERKVLITPRLSDFFSVKRGIATGDNKYFILTKSDIESKGLPISQFKPILPSPRHLSGIEVETDDLGYPSIEDKLFVLDCKLAISEVERLYPELYTYLQVGIRTGVALTFHVKSEAQAERGS